MQFITILKAMSSLLGEKSDGFDNNGVVCYDFMSEIFSKING